MVRRLRQSGSILFMKEWRESRRISLVKVSRRWFQFRVMRGRFRFVIILMNRGFILCSRRT